MFVQNWISKKRDRDDDDDHSSSSFNEHRSVGLLDAFTQL
jgi:hypothetical protein